MNVAVGRQMLGEQLQLWPYNCRGETFIVAIYAKSFFPPPRFEVEGFLILKEKVDIVEDRDFCKRVARDFFIWRHVHFVGPEKYVPFRKKFFSNLRKFLHLSLDNCRNRYENDQYEKDDPAKGAYVKVLKELDLDIIQNYPLLLRNLEIWEKMIDLEKSIWQRCSCEKIEAFERLLTEYHSVLSKMGDFAEKRAEMFYHFERAIKDAYKIDLQISRYSLLSKASLSFLLWLVSTNFYSLAIPFLPEVLKLFYQTLMGYKSLLRTSKRYLQKAKRTASLLDLFEMPIESSKIWNF